MTLAYDAAVISPAAIIAAVHTLLGSSKSNRYK